MQSIIVYFNPSQFFFYNYEESEAAPNCCRFIIYIWANFMGYKFAKLASNIKTIGESNKSQSPKDQVILYELNSPKDLFLPSRSREVLVNLTQKVNLDQLENILINNNRKIKIYLEKLNKSNQY